MVSQRGFGYNARVWSSSFTLFVLLSVSGCSLLFESATSDKDANTPACQATCDGMTLRSNCEEPSATECSYACVADSEIAQGARCATASNLLAEACRGVDAPDLNVNSEVTLTFVEDGDEDCTSYALQWTDGEVAATAVLKQPAPFSDLVVFCLGSWSSNSSFVVEPKFGACQRDGNSVNPAIGIYVEGPVDISGTIDLTGGPGVKQGGGSGGRPGPGAGKGANSRNGGSGHPGEGQCGGAGGTYINPGTGSGGGGAGWAGAGGNGGDALFMGTIGNGGVGRASCGTRSLSPLGGGSGGGSGGESNYCVSTSDKTCSCTRCGQPAGGGGGAIQIASATSISVAGDIDSRGGDGRGADAENVGGGGGGGSGGSVLLEAPIVEIEGIVDVSGGNGGNTNAFRNAESAMREVRIGGFGGSSQDQGSGGEGQSGEGVSGGAQNGAGGGGGAGYIRINTAEAAALCSPEHTIGICTSGLLPSPQ